MSDERSIELEVEVPGTPEEVWAAVATGPGISSWFVPTTVEERAGGAMTQHFGPGLDVEGKVTAWEPPHRVAFGADGAAMAFEWLVEAREGGTCVVRLINSGFGTGEEWDAQYDGMAEGWLLFLHNLQLHRQHFPGEHGIAVLPMAVWAGSREEVWERVVTGLGLPAAPTAGDAVAATAGDAPPLAGEVVQCTPGFRMSVLLHDPAPGTAFLAVERMGEHMGVSVWLYLYGDAGMAAAARDGEAWRAWLAARGVAMEEPPAPGA